jgi:sugar phosphate isomerase/epimerase
MQIGISRPSWGEQDNDLIFRLADRMGFDGVQIKPHQYDDIALNAERFKQKYGEFTHLAKGGLITYPGPHYRTWKEKLPDYFAFASALHAEQVCICSDVRSVHLDEHGIQGVVHELTEIGKLARDQGIAISLHNHADTIFESVEDLQRVFSYIEPVYCGLTFDTAHAAKGGIGDLAAAIEAFKPFINNVHLKDLSASGRFCPLGSGTLDLVPVVRKLQEIRYDEWIIIDEETEGMSVEEAFTISMCFLEENGLK